MKPPHINIDHLITYYFVASRPSFASAAEELRLTQPAVSMRVRALETHFGVKLINVRKKRISLTREGELLLPHAERVYRSVIAAELLLESQAESPSLHIGIASAVTLHFLPIVEKFRVLHPFVNVTMREGTSFKLVEELRNYEHDLCVVATSAAIGSDLKVNRLQQLEKLVLVTSCDHPLADREDVAWEDLEHYPLVLRCKGSVARNILIEELDKRGLKPHISAETDNDDAIKAMIRQGDGVAFMFLPSVRREVAERRLRVLPLDSGAIEVGTDVVMRRETEMSPASEAFLSLMADQFD